MATSLPTRPGSKPPSLQGEARPGSGRRPESRTLVRTPGRPSRPRPGLRTLSPRGKNDREDRSPIGSAARRDRPSVPVHDALHDGEPEPGPALAADDEGLEDPPPLGVGNAAASVLHRAADPPSAFGGGTHPDVHHRPGGRMLDRVGNQVLEHLLQPTRVAWHGGNTLLEGQRPRDPRLLGPAPAGLNRAAGELWDAPPGAARHLR